MTRQEQVEFYRSHDIDELKLLFAARKQMNDELKARLEENSEQLLLIGRAIKKKEEDLC